MFLKVHKRVDSFVKKKTKPTDTHKTLVWSFKLKNVLSMAIYLYVWAVHQSMKGTKVQSGWNSYSCKRGCLAYVKLMNTSACCINLFRGGLIYFYTLFH